MRNTTKSKSGEVVTLAEAKEHLNIESSYVLKDSYITDCILEATEEAEGYLDEDILLTIVTDIYADFVGSCLKVEESPLIDITSIHRYDSEGNETEIESTEYKVRKGQQLFFIEFDNSYDVHELKIVFRTGYLTEATCPSFIKRAIKKKVADYYDVERGSMTSKAFQDSKGFERILNRQQRRTF
jgi:hypothetical protein